MTQKKRSVDEVDVLEAALPSDLHRHTVSAARISHSSPIVTEALKKRQGFKSFKGGATLGFPDSWSGQQLPGYKNSAEELVVVRDQQGRQRGILSVAEDARENKLMLTPRFNVLVTGSNGHQKVMLNDGGVRSYRLARITAPMPPQKARALVDEIIHEKHPQLENPLALWDRQSGHAKKGLIARLRSSFAAVDGFQPYGDLQANSSSQKEPVNVRPRLRLSTRRYEKREFVESRGTEVVVDRGQEIVLIDDQARGTKSHIIPLHKISRQDERQYSRTLKIAEGLFEEMLPDARNITAYRHLTPAELALRAADISSRIERLVHVPAEGHFKAFRKPRLRDLRNAQREKEEFQEFGL